VFLQERLFGPFGMADTGYADGGPKIAQGYATATAKAADYEPAADYAAGGLYSTAAGLLRWDQALYIDTPLTADSRAERRADTRRGWADCRWVAAYAPASPAWIMTIARRQKIHSPAGARFRRTIPQVCMDGSTDARCPAGPQPSETWEVASIDCRNSPYTRARSVGV
jgi:CubicO group peptidase (beta-lactamase class C family)